MISSCVGSSSSILFACAICKWPLEGMANEDSNSIISDAVDGVLNDLIDWAALEIIFELHRAVKLGYYRELVDPDPSNIEKRGTSCVVHDVIMVCCVVYQLWRQVSG